MHNIDRIHQYFLTYIVSMLALIYTFTAASAGAVQEDIVARPRLRIMASPDLFLFTQRPAEAMAKISKQAPSIVESAGAGMAVHLFCTDYGINAPHAVVMMRPMTNREVELCNNNSVLSRQYNVGSISVGASQRAENGCDTACPIYIFVRPSEHTAAIAAFIREILSERASGDDGYLTIYEHGYKPLPADLLIAQKHSINTAWP